MHFGVGLSWRPPFGIFPGGGVSFLSSPLPPPGIDFGLVDIFIDCDVLKRQLDCINGKIGVSTEGQALDICI